MRRLVAERRIPYLKVGHFVRFEPAEIAAWLDDARQPGSAGSRGSGMAAAPEPLRLFGASEEAEGVALAGAAHRPPEEASLQRLHQAGRLVAQAQARLDSAVIAAHKAGCSWRRREGRGGGGGRRRGPAPARSLERRRGPRGGARIGAAAGVPYQSLHRRLADQAEPKGTARRGRRG